MDNDTKYPHQRTGNRAGSRRLRLAVGVLAGLIILSLVVLAVIPPLIIGPMVNQHVSFDQTWTAAEYGLPSERLVLTTIDGLDVVAYEVPVDQPRAVVIFLSGIHNPSVTAFFGHAAMIRDVGYASILLEMRAHGESEGDTIALGYTEYLDVQAVVDHIKMQAEYEGVPIVVYGVSMGGATAINAIGQIPELDGLVSMSAYSSWADVFVEHMGVGEPIATLQHFFVRLYTTIKYGWDSRHLTPANQIQYLGARHALIIHSRGDSQVPFSSFERILDNAPGHVETWIRDGDLHLIVADGHFAHPWEDNEYAERILGFLQRHWD